MADTKLVNVLMEPAMIERLDDFRFDRRFTSRAAAIKWLLTWALDQQPRKERDGDQERDQPGQQEAAA